MSFIGRLFGGGGAAPVQQQAALVPTRNAAAEAAARADALAKRHGTLAAMINGARGTEAGTTGKTKLGV